MKTIEIVAMLEQAGVQLWEAEGELRFRAPRGALTDELRATINTHRSALLEVLHSSSGIVQCDPDARYHPFPLTDVQSAYLFGQHADFGDVACHMYVEIALGNVDPEVLESAWNRLIARHEMLRAVIDPDGSQHIIEKVSYYQINITKSSQAEVRKEMGHCMRDPAHWPLFELRLTMVPDNAILHLSVDFIIADWASIRILQGELELLRQEPESELLPLKLTFRDYVLAERRNRESMRFARDRAYWLDRIDSLPPPPQLPLALDASSITSTSTPYFQRLALRLAPKTWAGLLKQASGYGVTPSSVILAAYAEVLGMWSQRCRFTLNLTLLNRQPLHPDVDCIVGDFTSVNLLVVDNECQARFAERTKALSAQLFDDLDHRLFSGVEVIREIARRHGRDAALMPVVFTSAIGVGNSDSQYQPHLGWGITQTPQVWIDCQAMDWQDGLLINWDVREGVLADGIVEDMFGAFSGLLERLAEDESAWLAYLPLNLPADQVLRHNDANNTLSELPDGLLHDAVFAAALRMPERCALVSANRSFNYAELAGYAVAVAEALNQAACRPGQRVAIVMDKGWEQIVAVLGTLRVGAVWLPIDTNQPLARREQMLHEADVSLILTQSWLRDEVAQLSRRNIIEVDKLAPQTPPITLPERLVQPDELAYVIFTSGSSGKPKGVMVSHASALNTIVDVGRRFGMRDNERVLGLANLGFDLSVYDIFGTLSAGGCLVLPDAERRADPSHWAEMIVRHQVSLWNSVPAQLQMLELYLAATREMMLPSLRLALLSGDWIPPGLPQQVRQHIPQLEIISLGGATEAAIWSIFHRIDKTETFSRSIPYGKPLANQRFYVLNARWQPCPDLVTGELYIGGAGLAIGYLADPVQTAQRFVSHPDNGERLYRTGDLGRYRRDGSIEFLGREDAQVKIRGNRVELAEVEFALKSYSGVREVVVIVDGDERLHRRLVAFVVPFEQEQASVESVINTDLLSAHAALLLPPYMIPARTEIIAALPLSENGKVDRKMLRALAVGLPAEEALLGEEPQTELERQLAKIWAEVLELPRVGREQDFFLLGGDSLQAARMVGQIRENVPKAAGLFFDSLVRQLLPNPTIAALASFLNTESQRVVHQAEASSATSPLLHFGGGDSKRNSDAPAQVLIHDGTGRLAAYRTLWSPWVENDQSGPLFGLRVTEAQSFLHPGPANLLERRATSYVRLLQASDQHRVQLFGRGCCALLAFELACQLVENDVEVLALTLIDPCVLTYPATDAELSLLFDQEMSGEPMWSGVDCIEDEAVLRRLFTESVLASTAHVPSTYMGDMTVLRTRGMSNIHELDWQTLIVGELRQEVLSILPSTNGVVHQLFDTTSILGIPL